MSISMRKGRHYHQSIYPYFILLFGNPKLKSGVKTQSDLFHNNIHSDVIIWKNLTTWNEHPRWKQNAEIDCLVCGDCAFVVH